MRSIIALGLMGSLALLAAGCGTGDESETESLAQVDQAIGPPTATYYFQINAGANGGMVFLPYTLYQNCKLSLETTGGYNLRDPVMGIIINNGNPLAWGSSTTPCHHGTYQATDSYNTLAYSDNISSTNYNARLSYTNTSGGSPITVFGVGFLNGTSQTVLQQFGPLNVKWSISGCADTSKNASGTFSQDFQVSGVKEMLPGYAYTWPPRPGGPQDASDTVLFELNPTVGGSGKCNDDCPDFQTIGGVETQSCIANNSGSNIWYFSPNWYSVGSASVNY